MDRRTWEQWTSELSEALGVGLRLVGEPSITECADGPYGRATAESEDGDRAALATSWTVAILSAPQQDGAPRVWALAFGRIAGERVRSGAGDMIGVDRVDAVWKIRGWETDEYGEWDE